jgi:transketolase
MEKKATREAYGETLVKLGKENENIVVLDADLSGSTKTALFARQFPDRFFNMGIAEQNMMATASGLATVGKIPFVSSFAMFATGRAWEMLRQSVCLGEKNVKVVATHSGVTVGEDGATHQALEDIAITRVIPHLSVIVPADYYETKKAVEYVANTNGAFYVRLSRSATPVVFDENVEFNFGKVSVVKEGKDLTVFACGIMVAVSLAAAKLLDKQGISVEVVNVSTLKPLDVEGVVASAKKTGKIVTVEEHNIIGGLGSAISEVLSENLPVKVKRIGIDQQFGRSGTGDELLEKFNLTDKGIAKVCTDFFKE